MRLVDYGAEEQNRTADTAVFSRVLYQLSYLGIVLAVFYTEPQICQEPTLCNHKRMHIWT